MSLSYQIIAEMALGDAIEKADYKICEKGLVRMREINEETFKVKTVQIFKLKAKAWKKNDLVEDMVRTIEIIQSYNINITISLLPQRVFFFLLFERPELAYIIISNTFAENENFIFQKKISSFSKYNFLGISKSKDKALSECISLLLSTDLIATNGQQFFKSTSLFIMMIQNDCPLSVFALRNEFSQETLFELFRWDSVNTFNMLYQHWLDTRILSEDDSILTQAVVNRAYKCVRSLLSRNSKAINKNKSSLITQAVNAGDGIMVLALTGDDYTLAADYLFHNGESDFSNIDEDLDTLIPKFKLTILKLLRFTPLDTVEKLSFIFLEKKTSYNNYLLETYYEMHRKFRAYAPYCSRYSDANSLTSLKRVYQNTRTKLDNFGNIARDDLKYGKKRSNLAEKLFAQLSMKATAQKEPFASLPPSSTGGHTVAGLLEKIADWHYLNLSMTVENRDSFKTLRDGICGGTPCVGRYSWAASLIHSVFLYSQDKDVIHNKLNKQFFYTLTYRDQILTYVGANFIGPGNGIRLVWNHGIELPNKTWGDIEDLWDKAWSMELIKPTDETNKDEVLNYEKSLTVFYETVAELVWLIGNTQPLLRGTGTVAEILLAIIHKQHEHHGLQLPVLKLDFPQLDVLDITFPLSDYKYFFPYFFEPATIPKHLQRKDMSSLPLIEQMKELYADLNCLKQSNAEQEAENVHVTTSAYFTEKNENHGIQTTSENTQTGIFFTASSKAHREVKNNVSVSAQRT